MVRHGERVHPMWVMILVKVNHLLLTINSATNILLYSYKVSYSFFFCPCFFCSWKSTTRHSQLTRTYFFTHTRLDLNVSVEVFGNFWRFSIIPQCCCNLKEPMDIHGNPCTLAVGFASTLNCFWCRISNFARLSSPLFKASGSLSRCLWKALSVHGTEVGKWYLTPQFKAVLTWLFISASRRISECTRQWEEIMKMILKLRRWDKCCSFWIVF